MTRRKSTLLSRRIRDLNYLTAKKIGGFVYTDYPFEEFGETSFEAAEVKRVKLLSWDGDKYCKVELPDGQVSEVKRGYLFRTRKSLEKQR